MRLIVPTYRRHSNGEAQTFRNIPVSVPITLVVREEEEAEYTEMLSSLGREYDAIWSIPTGQVDGIADTRNWILRKSYLEDETKIVMLDDDLHFIVRGKVPFGEPGWDYKLREMEEADWPELMDWFGDTLGHYAHCALSSREGNNRTPGLRAYSEATRGIRAVGYNISKFFSRAEFRREVEGREDLDMTLQLLRMGLPNIVTYHWAQGQRTADAPGGLEGVRTAEHHDRTAHLLTELHPGLVRTRKKINKTGAMAGERTEVTIYWKKALESSS